MVRERSCPVDRADGFDTPTDQPAHQQRDLKRVDVSPGTGVQAAAEMQIWPGRPRRIKHLRIREYRSIEHRGLRVDIDLVIDVNVDPGELGLDRGAAPQDRIVPPAGGGLPTPTV